LSEEDKARISAKMDAKVDMFKKLGYLESERPLPVWRELPVSFVIFFSALFGVGVCLLAQWWFYG
jgi:hypothetical protein